MTDKLGPNEMIHLHEQMEATMSNFAPIVSSYYLALLDNGVPGDLAYKFVTDWHYLYWEKIMDDSFSRGKK